MSQRLEEINDLFTQGQGAPQSIRDAAAQAWDPRCLDQTAAKSASDPGQYIDCSPIGGGFHDLSVRPTNANSILSCESPSGAGSDNASLSSKAGTSGDNGVISCEIGKPQKGDGGIAQSGSNSSSKPGSDNGAQCPPDSGTQCPPESGAQSAPESGSTSSTESSSTSSSESSSSSSPESSSSSSPESSSSSSPESSSSSSPESGSSSSPESGSSSSPESSPAGSDSTPPAGSDSTPSAGSDGQQPSMDQMVQAIMSALQQALQQSGGDPTKFLQFFMQDLMQALQQMEGGGGSDPSSGQGGGSDSGSSDSGSSSQCPPDTGSSSTPDTGGSSAPDAGGASGGGDTGTGSGSQATGVSSLLNFSNDPNATPELKQQLTQELNNMPTDIQNKLLQQGTQINIVPESQLGDAAGLYDTGNNQITIGDGSGVEQEALAHEVSHALDVGPSGDGITNSAGFQSAMNTDLQNGLPSDFNDYASTLNDSPSNNQFGFGEGDVYAEIAAGLLGQDQSGLPQEIAKDFPNTTSYIAQQLGVADQVA